MSASAMIQGWFEVFQPLICILDADVKCWSLYFIHFQTYFNLGQMWLMIIDDYSVKSSLSPKERWKILRKDPFWKADCAAL